MPTVCLRVHLRESGQQSQGWGVPPTTHFRVSFMLQVEQEKQFTHQALLRADTTVRPDAELAGPPKPAAGPASKA